MLTIITKKGKTMKILIVTLTLLFTSSIAMAHGGGCRKSSPPGQCCHMQTSTGTVHCH
jgi:hypothetical protein